VKKYSFCPVCGSPYHADRASPVPASLLACAACGFQFWQNSKPAIGAFIVRVSVGGPEVLLTRRGIEPYKGMWDCPGGFLENGELPEDGLARELSEELGIRVEKPRLFWTGIDEYPRNDVAEEARFVLSLYYRCEMAPDARPAAADDVAEFAWFPLDEPPEGMAFASNRRALHELQASLKSEMKRGSRSG
jgi:ADP-ribose pyrophosphatase YjhB (NUDIX family)